MAHAYGTWPSPITAGRLTDQTVGLGDPAFDGDDLYWLQADPTDGGRVTLRRLRAGVETALTPAPHNVRSRVHEYGGGAFAVADGHVVFSDFADNRLYLITPEDPQPRALTADSDLRYGALQVDPVQDLIIAVREDHRGLGGTSRDTTESGPSEPVNTIIARRISDPPEVADRVLCAGADFYAGPRLGPDGRLAWIEWVHPNMPWDSTTLRTAALPLDGDGRVDLGARGAEPVVGASIDGHRVDVETIAGGPGESVAAPSWGRDGELIFVSDRTDWWNLYRWSPGDAQPEALCPVQAEFAPPQWTLGGSPYVVVDDRVIACTVNRENRVEPALLDTIDGQLTALPTGAVGVGSLSCNGSRLACHLSYADRPAELVLIELADDTGLINAAAATTTTLRRSSATTFPVDIVSTATAVSWPSQAGPVHGWYYPPVNDGFQAPAGELPPMITISHGGPTSGSSPTYRLGIQFWTSRGIAVLDVNYGGSTGYGRRYRERLHHRWGELDVTDCADGARAMAEQGRADPARLAIQGSSAGGYTTLRAITETDVFAAGISHFGIGDLTALVADTHKFESRYPESLIGVWPAQAQLYADRSPINHVDRLRAPILLTQGTEDKVVPPNQAKTFAAAARVKGLPVALIMYEGEGHGFRRAENIINSQQAALTFLGRVFGFAPADDLPELTIENL